MSTRININKVDPTAYKALLGMEDYLANTALTALEKELIKIRSSQINGCAYCINAHTKDARKLGESENRLYMLSAWREAPYYTKEERAILALTEEVTLITKGVSDETYDLAIEALGEKKTTEVIMAAIAINAWNRIGVSTRMTPEN